MCNPTYIKVTVTQKEIERIDEALRHGHGRSRADLCRIAIVDYLEDIDAARGY